MSFNQHAARCWVEPEHFFLHVGVFRAIEISETICGKSTVPPFLPLRTLALLGSSTQRTCFCHNPRTAWHAEIAHSTGAVATCLHQVGSSPTFANSLFVPECYHVPFISMLQVYKVSEFSQLCSWFQHVGTHVQVSCEVLLCPSWRGISAFALWWRFCEDLRPTCNASLSGSSMECLDSDAQSHKYREWLVGTQHLQWTYQRLPFPSGICLQDLSGLRKRCIILAAWSMVTQARWNATWKLLDLFRWEIPMVWCWMVNAWMEQTGDLWTPRGDLLHISWLDRQRDSWYVHSKAGLSCGVGHQCRRTHASCRVWWQCRLGVHDCNMVANWDCPCQLIQWCLMTDLWDMRTWLWYLRFSLRESGNNTIQPARGNKHSWRWFFPCLAFNTRRSLVQESMCLFPVFTA